MTMARWILTFPAALLCAFVVDNVWAGFANRFDAVGSYVDIVVSALLYGAIFVLVASLIAPRKGRRVRLVMAGVLTAFLLIGLIPSGGRESIDWARTAASVGTAVVAAFVVASAWPARPLSPS